LQITGLAWVAAEALAPVGGVIACR
jgi:hypothetical protein